MQHPLVSFDLWGRFLLGVAVVVWLPGWIWVGRHLVKDPHAIRHLASLVWGLVLAPLAGVVISHFGPWFRVQFYLPVVVAAGLLLGRSSGWRRALACGLASAVDDRREREDSSGGILPWVACGLMAALTLSAWAVSPVPEGDAANHAFLVARVSATGSTAQAAIFGPPYASPGFVYLPGWHGAAALGASVTGLPPYLASWFMPLLALCLLPPSLGVLWPRLGVAPLAAALGAVFLVADEYFPAGLLGWGGFGHFLGWFLVTPLVLATLSLRRTGAWPWGAIVGLGLSALILIHAVELGVWMLLVLIGIAADRRAGLRAHWRSPGALLALGLLSCCVVIVAASSGADYGLRDAPQVAGGWRGLGRGIDAFTRGVGKWPPLRILFLAGLVLAWRRRPLRPWLAGTALLAALYLLRSTMDTMTVRRLTQLWYSDPTRILHALMFLAPPLMGTALVALAQRLRARGVPQALALAVLVGVAVGPAAERVWSGQRHLALRTSIAAADVPRLRGLGSGLEPGALLAGLVHDGSQWAWHLANIQVLQPMTWPQPSGQGPDLLTAVAGFAQRPWPPETRALVERGVTHVWVGTRPTEFAPARVRGLFQPPAFDADRRFAKVMAGDGFAAYRIVGAE